MYSMETTFFPKAIDSWSWTWRELLPRLFLICVVRNDFYFTYKFSKIILTRQMRFCKNPNLVCFNWVYLTYTWSGAYMTASKPDQFSTRDVTRFCPIYQVGHSRWRVRLVGTSCILIRFFFLIMPLYHSFLRVFGRLY